MSNTTVTIITNQEGLTTAARKLVQEGVRALDRQAPLAGSLTYKRIIEDSDFFAVTDDGIASVVIMDAGDYYKRSTAFITMLFVRKRSRNQGIGTSLVHAIGAELRRRKVDLVEVTTACGVASLQPQAGEVPKALHVVRKGLGIARTPIHFVTSQIKL